ncbi:MAG: PBP1A family penicillin-binding protein [Desulfotignum sp.]|nr:PBP1A family penicillin-binding protein [Desulfotignum sp.]MCF8137689.1 PBP1A family penicillin-binding protein [Desulfotignum sp.]
MPETGSIKKSPETRTFCLTLALCLALCLTQIAVPVGSAFGNESTPALDILSCLKQLKEWRPPLTTTVYAKDGSILAYFYRENRYYAPLESLPKHLKQAFIAVEDSAFYTHDGIDPQAVFRAFSNNLKAGSWQQGGSTITQQVVKRLVLSGNKNLERKFKEALLAYHLEQHLTKDQILAIYLNEIYFGAGAYGIEAAARTYFNCHARDLTLAQAALLAGLPKSPSRLNPYQAPEMAAARQQYVLERMLTEQFISRDQFEVAAADPLLYKRMPDPSWKEGAYFLSEVRRRLIKALGKEKMTARGIVLPAYGEDALYQGGLHIYTTYDRAHQAAAVSALRQGLDRLTQYQDSRPQGAVLSMDPHSGEVKALAGGYDWQASQFNRATQALRQPGSLFKPVVFSAALARGYSPASLIMDAPFSVFQPTSQTLWVPGNFSGTYRGPTLLARALIHSINVATARLALEIGIDNIIEQARQMGFESDLPRVPAVSLGACETTLNDLVRVYSAFPRGGTWIEPRLVLAVYDHGHRLLFDNPPQTARSMSSQNAYIITHLLKKSVDQGTGWRASALGHPAAGKTGTSNDCRDAWFVGFTPYLLTGVFVGFDDAAPMGDQGTGARAASPIWLDYHQAVKPQYEYEDFLIPPGICFGSVNAQGHFLGEGWHENAIVLPFSKQTGFPDVTATPLYHIRQESLTDPSRAELPVMPHSN